MYDPCYCVCNICLFMYLLGDGIDIDIVKLRTEHLMIQSTDNRERAMTIRFVNLPLVSLSSVNVSMFSTA